MADPELIFGTYLDSMNTSNRITDCDKIRLSSFSSHLCSLKIQEHWVQSGSREKVRWRLILLHGAFQGWSSVWLSEILGLWLLSWMVRGQWLVSPWIVFRSHPSTLAVHGGSVSLNSMLLPCTTSCKHERQTQPLRFSPKMQIKVFMVFMVTSL